MSVLNCNILTGKFLYTEFTMLSKNESASLMVVWKWILVFGFIDMGSTKDLNLLPNKIIKEIFCLFVKSNMESSISTTRMDSSWGINPTREESCEAHLSTINQIICQIVFPYLSFESNLAKRVADRNTFCKNCAAKAAFAIMPEWQIRKILVTNFLINRCYVGWQQILCWMILSIFSLC